MKTFISKIIIFFLPIILFFLVPSLFLFKATENFNYIDSKIKSGEKYLIGYIYNENNYKYLKWKQLSEEPKHSVVALGTSRVIQFRKEMFNASFYNAGYTVEKISHYKPFLESIPEEKYPDYLLISLDQWMFNPAWEDSSKPLQKDIWSGAFTFIPSFHTCLDVYADLLDKKYSFSDFDTKSNYKLV